MDDARIADRIGAAALGVRRRALLWGWACITVGALAWVVAVWQPWDAGRSPAAWWPVLAGALAPGVVVVGFARRVRRLAALPERVEADRETATAGAGRLIRARGLPGLLAALREARGGGEALRGALTEAAGTARLFNPAYLGLVALAAGAAGVVVIGGLAAVLLVVA